jgi:hypothetical protein
VCIYALGVVRLKYAEQCGLKDLHLIYPGLKPHLQSRDSIKETAVKIEMGIQVDLWKGGQCDGCPQR